jgi:hypothetical protein
MGTIGDSRIYDRMRIRLESVLRKVHDNPASVGALRGSVIDIAFRYNVYS